MKCYFVPSVDDGAHQVWVRHCLRNEQEERAAGAVPGQLGEERTRHLGVRTVVERDCDTP
jgi:hypothetical protein